MRTLRLLVAAIKQVIWGDFRGNALCYAMLGSGPAATRTVGDASYVYQVPARDRILRRIRAQPRLPERYTRAGKKMEGKGPHGNRL